MVPDELVASFDVRLTPLLELKEFDRQVCKWIQEAGEGVTIDYYQKHMDQVSDELLLLLLLLLLSSTGKSASGSKKREMA